MPGTPTPALWPNPASSILIVAGNHPDCRAIDHAPANFTTIKHMALNLIRKASGKDSIRLRRKVAAWDDNFLVSLIGG